MTLLEDCITLSEFLQTEVGFGIPVYGTIILNFFPVSVMMSVTTDLLIVGFSVINMSTTLQIVTHIRMKLKLSKSVV